MEEETNETGTHARFFGDNIPHHIPHNIFHITARGIMADP
jgi:hypothetical protein